MNIREAILAQIISYAKIKKKKRRYMLTGKHGITGLAASN